MSETWLARKAAPNEAWKGSLEGGTGEQFQEKSYGDFREDRHELGDGEIRVCC